jgi:hypothetical protein
VLGWIIAVAFVGIYAGSALLSAGSGSGPTCRHHQLPDRLPVS